MTIFELVKVALDELYKEGQAAYGAELDARILDRIAYLTNSYGKLNHSEREPVNYKDPATRFAYVYKYVAAHGDYVVQVLELLQAYLKGSIFTTPNSRVSCVGGGPGSDLIGVLKYLDENKNTEPTQKVTCYLLDKEQAWADTWTELDDSLEINHLSLHPNFQPLDVLNPESWQAQRKFLQADLFTLSFFVSEVRSLDQGGVVSNFWKTLFDNAKPGALFVYDDNGHDDFNGYFDAQWQAAGMQCLIAQDNVRFLPRYSEQASELGMYSQKFAHNPRIQAWLSYRVLRKP